MIQSLNLSLLHSSSGTPLAGYSDYGDIDSYGILFSP